MMLHTINIEEVDPEEFQQAAFTAKLLMHGLQQDQKLCLYGLYKQASFGDINISKPLIPYTEDYYKWYVMIESMLEKLDVPL